MFYVYHIFEPSPPLCGAHVLFIVRGYCNDRRGKRMYQNKRSWRCQCQSCFCSLSAISRLRFTRSGHNEAGGMSDEKTHKRRRNPVSLTNLSSTSEAILMFVKIGKGGVGADGEMCFM